MDGEPQRQDVKESVQLAVAEAQELQRFHEEIMSLDAMPLEQSMKMVRIYARWDGVYPGNASMARLVEHIKAAQAAHYRHKEKELAFSRERAEQRALWLVPLIHWGFGAVGVIGSAAIAATLWMVRFA